MESGVELHNINVQDFIKTLDSCVGRVCMRTNEGDCLNLKSKLSQLLGLTKLIEGGIIANARVFCDSQEDETKLFRLNLYKDVPAN